MCAVRAGSCSTYREMGIDVRACAQANLDVNRAPCVGCSMCAHPSPGGVLKCETKPNRLKDGTPIGI